jgi:hypothetical protein
MIDVTGWRPIEERSRAKTFMLDDHNQTNVCTNTSAPEWWFEHRDELEHVLRTFTGIESQKLLFATTFAGPEEYDYAFKKGATVLINDFFPLKSWPDVFKDRDIFLSKLGEKESRLTHIKGIEGADRTILYAV